MSAAVIAAIVASAGAVVGAVSGGLNWSSAEIQYNEKINSLTNTMNRLTDEYNEYVTATRNQANRNIAQLRANIADTKISQGVGLRSSAGNVAMQDQIAQMQMAQIQVDAQRQVGASVQDMAVSGVRRMEGIDPITGETITANAQVFNTKNDTDRSIAVAQAQRNLSRFQSLESARMNYYDADTQMASYRRSIKDTRAELKDTLNVAYRKYINQWNAYKDDWTYLNSKEGRRAFELSNTANFLSSMFGGASSAFSIYNSGYSSGLWGNKGGNG